MTVQALIAVPTNTYWRRIAKEDPEYDTAEEIDELRYMASVNNTILRKLVRAGAIDPCIHNESLLLHGTRVFSDHKLVNLIIEQGAATLAQMIQDGELDWTVLCYNVDGVPKKGYNSVVLLKFMANIPTYDEEGNPTGFRRPVSLDECDIGHMQGSARIANQGFITYQKLASMEVD